MTSVTEVLVSPSQIPVVRKKSESHLIQKIILYFLIFITTIYGLFLAVIIAASYTGWQPPLIPKRVVRLTSSALATVPFIPKTPEQVLTRSFAVANDIKSGETKFTLEIASTGGLPSENIDARLTFEGPVTETANGSTSFDLDANLDLKYAGEKSKYSASVLHLDDVLYFNLIKFPGLEKIANKWYRLDLKKLESQLNSTQNTEGLQEEYEKQMEEFFDTLDEKKIFDKIEQLPDENVGEAASYQ